MKLYLFPTANRGHVLIEGLSKPEGDSGKNLDQLCHPRLLRKWLKSAELVLSCMIQTNLLMGNCSWLS